MLLHPRIDPAAVRQQSLEICESIDPHCVRCVVRNSLQIPNLKFGFDEYSHRVSDCVDDDGPENINISVLTFIAMNSPFRLCKQSSRQQ